VLKYTAMSFGIIALATLAVTFFVARPPQDTPEPIFDETLVTAGGAKVRWVHPEEPEKGLIMLIGDNANPGGTADYAKQFADLSYNVVVIAAADLLAATGANAAPCLDVSKKLLALQDDLREQLSLDSEQLPILAGFGEGASVVYAALAQDSGHDFHAGVSINFSGQLHSDAVFCNAGDFVKSSVAGAIALSPVERLSTRWYLFQDASVSPAGDMRDFADQIANAKFTMRRNKDESVISQVLQILQWLDPRLTDQTSSDNTDGDLPLVEVPAEIDHPSQTMAIMITGDGGWAEIDKGIATNLAAQGIPTVALDSLSYFWKQRTPEELTDDVQDIMSEYLEKWHKKQVILIGFSFGADVLPFVANRIDEDNRKQIALVALLGIGRSAAFEFHLSSWLDEDHRTDRLPLAPEIAKLDRERTICIYGVDDEDADCAALSKVGIKLIRMSGDHHFDGKYHELVQNILDNVAGLPPVTSQ
jgi:type IV secretory pathway VirJ component